MIENLELGKLRSGERAAEKEKIPFTAKMPDAAYHGPIGEFVKFVDSYTEADPVAVLSQSLVMFGNILGRGPKFFLGESDIHTNEFLAIVGSTAKARKGTSLSIARNFIDPLDDGHRKNCRLNTLVSGEGLVHSLRDAAMTDKGADPGVTDKRLLVEAEEFGAVLTGKGRNGSTLTSTLRMAWDSRNLGNPTRTNSEFVTEPHLSLIGHITAHELNSLMMPSDTHNGFANRFIWLYVSKSKSIAFPRRLSADEMSRLRAPLENALLVGMKDQHLSLDEEAKELYVIEHARLGEEIGDPVFDAHTARGLVHMMKLAMIYALADAKHQIETPHFLAAKALWEYSEKSVEYIFERSGLSKLEAEILQYIVTNPGCTRTGLYRFKKNNLKKDGLDVVLRVLTSRGLIRTALEHDGASETVEAFYEAGYEITNSTNGRGQV